MNGHKYLYFGPFPALLRIVPNLLFPSARGEWSKLSCFLAAFVALLAFTRLSVRAVARNAEARPRARAALLHVAIIGFGLGSPLVYLVSCARIYHEAIIWALAGSLVALDAILEVLESRTSRAGALAIASAASAVALLSRVTFALPLAGALLAAGGVSLWRAVREPRPVRAGILVALAAIPGLAGAGLQLWYNEKRFGSPLKSIDFAYTYVNPDELGGVFTLRRLPSSLACYFGMPSDAFSTTPPFFTISRVHYAEPGLFFGWTEQTASLTLVSPWLLAGAGIGAILLLRRPRPIPLLLASLFLLQCVLIGSFYFVTQRYAAEFLPLLALLFAGFLSAVPLDTRAGRPVPAILLCLAAFSAAATVASTLHWNLVYNGDAPESWKVRLGHLLTPGSALPRWEGSRISLSGLATSAESADFAPLRRDATIEGAQIRFRGREERSGLGMHAEAAATWSVPAGAVAFEALAGLPDEVNQCEAASVVFEVVGGSGRVLFRSGVVRSAAPPVPVHVDLNGETTLTLAVHDAGDGHDCDHGTWARASFLLRPASR